VAVVESLACGRPVLISNQVNIWREIEECKAALVRDDTARGTTQLLEDWVNLSAEAKSAMATQAKTCFQRYFSLENATRRLISAIA
jgi:glycosyltransferase involved in cell wall biosynthesis